MKNIHIFVIASTFCIAGCLDPKVVETSATTDDDAVTIAPIFVSERISNGAFEFDFNPDPGKCAFKALRDDVTITDLANFARHDCWNTRIKAKIEKGEALTDNDVKLAEFCWKTQMMVVDTLSFAMLNDLTQNDAILQDFMQRRQSEALLDFKPVDGNVDSIESQTDAVYEELKVKFLSSNDAPLRKVIRKWGAQFRSADIPAEAWIETYHKVYGNRSTMTEASMKKNYKKWLWMPQVISSQAKRSSFGKSELRKYAKELDMSSDVTGERWQTMQLMSNKYLTELNDINAVLDSYTKKKDGKADARSVDLVQTMFEKNGEDTLAYNRYYKRSLYDMPLVAYSQRAYAEICAAKGFWNDDEELMMDAARRYVVAIRGIDMIQNAHSMYSISAYTAVIEKLKNELDEEEFKTLCTQTKLYKVDVADDPMTANPCSRLGQENR